MPKLTVNDIEVEVEDGATVLRMPVRWQMSKFRGSAIMTGCRLPAIAACALLIWSGRQAHCLLRDAGW